MSNIVRMCVRKKIVEAKVIFIIFLLSLNLWLKWDEIIDEIWFKKNTFSFESKSTVISDAPTIIMMESHDNSVRPTSENRSSNEPILVYNRVPKCGSSTLLTLVKILAKKNKFKSYSSGSYFRYSRVR